MQIDEGYVIYNTETGEVFRNDRSRFLWDSTGPAANSWNNVHRGYNSNRNAPRFSEQNVWVVKKVKVILEGLEGTAV